MTKKDIRSPHWPSFARSIKREAKGLEASEAGDFNPLVEKALSISDPYYVAMSLCWIGRRLDAQGFDGTDVFSKALSAAEKVPQEWRRSEILCFMAKEMSKTDSGSVKDLIDAVMNLRDPVLGRRTLNTVKRSMSRMGVDLSSVIKEAGPKTPPPRLAKETTRQGVVRPKPGIMGQEISLGLFNSYAGKGLKDAHIRAVARAVSLCIAYDLGLCLFNFPAPDTAELERQVAAETRVGETGDHIHRLLKKGWLSLMTAPKTPVLSDGGLLVATTSHPEPGKKTTLEEVLALKKPVCFLLGLGSSGLPRNILTAAGHHLELTGREISLETCTAMGVLSGRISSVRMS